MMSDHFLLENLLEDYDISENAIKLYEESEEYKAAMDGSALYKGPEGYQAFEDDDIDGDLNNIDGTEIDEGCEEETEEDFRQRNGEFDRLMENESKPFVCWHISTYCKRINDDLDILLKYLKKKPYFGLMLKVINKGKALSMNDEYYKMLYDMEMKRLRENDSEVE